MSHRKKQRMPRKISYFIALLGVLFYFYETILELVPSTIVQGLMRNFHINASMIGILDTTYFAVYALMQIPGGYLLDRFGAKKILTLAALCCCFGQLLFIMTNYLSIALIARVIMGFGGAFGLMGAMYLINKYIARPYLGFALGLAILFGLSGGLFSAPLTALEESYGWSFSLLLLAFVAGLLAIIFRLFLTDPGRPSDTPFYHDLLANLKQLLNYRALWPIAIYGGLIYIPTGTLANLWGIEYLKVYYQGDPAIQAAKMNGLIFLGWIVGSPFVGLISDRLKERRRVVLAGGVGLFLSLLLISQDTHLLVSEMFALMFTVGFFSSASGLTFAMGCESVPKVKGGMAVGFVNMMAILPTIIISPLFGVILDQGWASQMLHGAKIYPLHAYQNAFILEYGLVFVALLVGYFLMPETLAGRSRRGGTADIYSPGCKKGKIGTN